MIQSDTLAVKYYQLSAIQGLADAQSNLGFYYANGKGVDQSLAEAREWLVKAAKQGNKGAVLNLKMLDKMEGRTTSSKGAQYLVV